MISFDFKMYQLTWSIQGMTKNIPGPSGFPFLMVRPSLKMIARWYSWNVKFANKKNILFSFYHCYAWKLLTSTILMHITNENGKVRMIKMTEKIVAINTTTLFAADCLLAGGDWTVMLIKENFNFNYVENFSNSNTYNFYYYSPSCFPH